MATEQRANTIADVFKGVGKIAIYLVGILVAFDVVGIDTGPLLGSVAILGLALSFGSQNLVRDLVNGFFILVENQYAVDDWVRIGSHEGTVEQINIRSTRLRSATGVLLRALPRASRKTPRPPVSLARSLRTFDQGRQSSTQRESPRTRSSADVPR